MHLPSSSNKEPLSKASKTVLDEDLETKFIPPIGRHPAKYSISPLVEYILKSPKGNSLVILSILLTLTVIPLVLPKLEVNPDSLAASLLKNKVL